MAVQPQRSSGKLFQKATDYLRSGQFDRALKNYRRVLKEDPANIDAWILGGQAAFQSGHKNEGIRWLIRASEAKPDNPHAFYNLGVMYNAVDDKTNALKAYKKAAQIDNAFAAAHYNAGIAHFEIGESDEALTFLDAAISADPGHADAHAGRAFILRGMNKHQASIDAYREAVRIAPGHAKAWAGLGITLQQTGKLDEALDCFKKSRAADSDYPDATTNLADVLVELEQPEQAVEECNAFLRRFPADSGVLASKAIALNDAKQFDELNALIDMDRYVQVFQHDAPRGYSDIAAFNDALGTHVAQHKTLLVSPESHATREGKHTGKINDGNKGPVTGLETLIKEAVSRYMDTLGSDDPHPTVAHRPANYTLNVWAVVLERKGYQLPHIHPSAWLSGVYYARVPKVANDGGNNGWIEFGQPGPEYHFTAEPNLRLVKPEPGSMVLFPSFMFHRTIPFESDETRISVAFDVLPA